MARMPRSAFLRALRTAACATGVLLAAGAAFAPAAAAPGALPGTPGDAPPPRGAAPASAAAPVAPGRAGAATPAPPDASPPSASAQRLYDNARGRLLQVRTLLQGPDSQASVGSGFLVSPQGHVLTNWHVVSQVALSPKRYRLVYQTADGLQGRLELLAFDALHDLALVRIVPAEGGALPAAAARPLGFRPRELPLARGERIYSLGNPLDVGFAVQEGTYNGLAERGFLPNIFFGGSLNPGMSGGPALDGQGRVIGVNVATRRDGQSVSFLVPGAFAEDLLRRGRDAAPLSAAVWPELTRQLTAHQRDLVDRFVALPWRSAGHPRYRIPVPAEDFLRCWGQNSPADAKGLEFERSDCSMDSRVFVNDSLVTGFLGTRHEAYDGERLGPWRFAWQYSASFRNEAFGGGPRRTPPQCSDREVEGADGLRLRVVACLSAYRQLKGLHDLSVLVATRDHPTLAVLGRFDARGVDLDNALRLTDHYLKGFAWMPGAR